MLVPLLLAFQASVGSPAPDTALFPEREAFIRMYMNCDEARWPWGTAERFVPKTDSEIDAGVLRLRALERRWGTWFTARAGDSITPTQSDAWVYPLTERARLLDNFDDPRADGPHEALDIFVVHEGGMVRTPVAGVVVAMGDDWHGSYARRGGLRYQGGGLSRRAGNGVVIWDPASGGYVYFAHMAAGVLVHTGDVVRAGTELGRVGHTGNAAAPGHGHHLHFAFKQAGTACGIGGVMVAVDPYPMLKAARSRLGTSARS